MVPLRFEKDCYKNVYILIRRYMIPRSLYVFNTVNKLVSTTPFLIYRRR